MSDNVNDKFQFDFPKDVHSCFFKHRYKGVVASRKVVDRHIPTASLQCLSTGTWGEYEVFLRPCSLVLHKLRHAAKMRVLELVELSHHKNVVSFYGLTELPNGRCLVCNFCKEHAMNHVIERFDHVNQSLRLGA